MIVIGFVIVGYDVGRMGGVVVGMMVRSGVYDGDMERDVWGIVCGY